MAHSILPVMRIDCPYKRSLLVRALHNELQAPQLPCGDHELLSSKSLPFPRDAACCAAVFASSGVVYATWVGHMAAGPATVKAAYGMAKGADIRGGRI